MSAAHHPLAIDRAYDLRVLASVPATLALFAPGALDAQLRGMTAQRRAICFTILSPVRKRAAHDDAAAHEIATVLVCLHVAPEVAVQGAHALASIMTRAAGAEAEPVHEIEASLADGGRSRAAGFYREAVYTESDISVAITTHTPVELPPETLAAVAAATQGTAVDIVTTIAITPWRAELATRLQAERRARSTLH